MDSRGAANPVYEDFEPSTELIQEKDCDTIVFNLPDFRKDQLRVQLTTSNILRITGSRPIADNKWKRFHKEFPVSANSNIQQISAKFEGGKLYIRLPKVIVQEDKQETNLSPPKKPADELPPPQKTTTTTTQKQEANEKTASKADPSKPSSDQDDAPSTKEEPSSVKTAKEPQDADTGNHDGAGKTSIAKDEHENDKEKAMDTDPRIDDKVGERGAEARPQKYKNTASNVASSLKMPGRLTNAVLAVILAVSLGIYITKLIKSCKIDVNCI